MKLDIKLGLLWLFMLSPLVTMAQNISLIRGRVTDKHDQAILGASVNILGTTISASTDQVGAFTLNTKDVKVSLKISYTGYQSQLMQISLPQQQVLYIILEQDSIALQEVVVNTGYQQISRERATGSYVQLNKDQLSRRVSTDIISRIENLVPGLAFNRNPGAQNNPISIRGQSTINSGGQPLIVIDNFAYDGDLNTINPDDVESVTVLKDAAAASIWGAKAGNGVIVITTRKGKYNQPLKLNFNTSVNIGAKPDLFYQPKITASDYIEIERKRYVDGAYEAAETAVTKLALSPVVELLILKKNGADANMIDGQIEMLKKNDVRNDINRYLNQNSFNQKYALNFNGGSAHQLYNVSMGYDRNKLTDVGNAYYRLTLDASNTYKLLDDRLAFTTGIYYSETIRKNNSLDFSPVYPYAMLADKNGKMLEMNKYRPDLLLQAQQQQLLDWTYKPLDEIGFSDDVLRLNDYRINTSLQYKVLNGLKAGLLYQYGRSINQSRKYQSQETYYTRDQINKLTFVNTDGSLIRPIPLNGILDSDFTEKNNHNFRAQLDFNRSWGEKHAVYGLAGTEVISNHLKGNTYRLYGYSDDYATSKIVDYVSGFKSYINPSSTTNKITNTDSQRELRDHYLSYYGNTAYSYVGRYTLSGSVRLDQSNLFGVKTNQKGIPLYSTGASWLFSAEPFYKLEWLPYLKIRATYGYNGNVNKSLSALTTARILPAVNSVNNMIYAAIQNPPNPELRWERVKIINFGADFKASDNWLSGSIEYYRKKGIDLIGSRPFAPATGITIFTGNYANTIGYGWELNLTTQNINKPFSWSTNFLFSYVNDKVSKYSVQSSTVNLIQGGDGSFGSIIYPVEGKPLFALYGYKWAGLDPVNGDPQGYLNNDISKDYMKIIAAGTESLEYSGPARPPIFGTVLNNFSYGSFTLSVGIGYKFGYYFRERSISYSNDNGLSSNHGDYSKRWLQSGDETFTNVPSRPRSVNSNRDNFYRNSAVNIKKGDHVRLQDLNVNYMLFNKKDSNIPKAQLYLYLNNIGVIWKGGETKLDPDYPLSDYPPLRTIAVGFKINMN